MGRFRLSVAGSASQAKLKGRAERREAHSLGGGHLPERWQMRGPAAGAHRGSQQAALCQPLGLTGRPELRCNVTLRVKCGKGARLKVGYP